MGWYQRRVHGIIKVLFISLVILIMPMCIQICISIIVILILIMIINTNNLSLYNLFINSDLISIRLIILRLWVLMLIKLRQFNVKFIKSLFFMFIMLNLRLIFSFRSNNILYFYFFFEWSLIPIFFIIIGWGYQIERLKSSFYLLIYTLFASLPLLLIIILINKYIYILNINYLNFINRLSINNLFLVFIFLAFLVKFPIFFFHQWLPKAHVEAPVGGSIILAGLLLKLGGYGIIRMLYFLKITYTIKIIIIISILGGRILRILCLINRDIKVIIAYSSVVHIALIIVNIFIKRLWSINGTIIIIIAHGVCSSGIFSCANIIYERTHSRIIIINKRNLNFFPSLSMFWFLLCIANFGGPFTYNLLGEIILIIRLRFLNYYFLLFIFIISFFSAAYRIILYANLQQGANNNLILNINTFNFREINVLYCHLWPLLIILLNPMLI